MRVVDVIRKKRDGLKLSQAEINFLIQGYTDGLIPDYQMAAWAMAVYFRGMTDEETAQLTMAMASSGDRLDLSGIRGIVVDKHSTGGVGDKTTLIVAPIVASSGVPVAKMSGRGLGHTGGTIDKLEAIPGFRVEMNREDLIAQVNRLGLALISQTGNLTPADKLLYGLRDVTATVESIPLIASSVMSKKIASGAGAIVLDVKTGAGAFMKDEAASIQLAEAMVAIGRQVGRETVAVVSDMDQPLGLAVGNALEVAEAIHTLQGRGPADLTEISLVLAARMIHLGGGASSLEAALAKSREALEDGRALERFRLLVEAQGGSGDVVHHPERLPRAASVLPVPAPRDGMVAAIDSEAVGLASMKLGAGREKKNDPIDPRAGIVLNRKIGDPVRRGEPLAYLHAGGSSRNEALAAIGEEVVKAYRIDAAAGRPKPLVRAVVDAQGVHRP